jgi:hypothetical protein
VPPATVALKDRVPPVIEVAGVGVTVTAVTPEPPTVTVAVADLVGSATLVAVILPVTRVAGAVKTPPLVMLPTDAVQVTALPEAVPWIAAVNCTLELMGGDTIAGDTAIELTGPLPPIDFPKPTQPEAHAMVEAKKVINIRTRDSRSSFIGTVLSFSQVPFFLPLEAALEGSQADVE